jgi:antitoxin (DNA-binding transcriptional repressor) of toxin-antitoxin stability system
LIDQAVDGELFIIAKAGKPLVMVTRLGAPAVKQVRRIGCMAGQFAVPDDFDRMGATDVAQQFGDSI